MSLQRLFLLVVCTLLTACASATNALDATPASHSVPTLFPTRAAALAPTTSAAQPDTGWTAGSNGIELRHLEVASGGGQSTQLIVVRMNPALVQLHVAYAPEQPQLLNKWFDDRKPLLAVNGSFFTPEYRATALLISAGTASGASYDGFGGMFAVASDGHLSLWGLRDQAYSPDAGYVEGLQSFPMLVFPGGTPADINEDGKRARRTAIALDHTGHVLIIVSPSSHFTLREFGQWLATSDLAIDRALNFDGGSSTGLFVNAGDAHEQINSFGRLPIVLFAEAKDS